MSRMKPLILIVFVIIGFSIKSQHDHQFTMYWNDISVYNPAFSGVNTRHHAYLYGRNQWVGFANGQNPKTVIAAYDVKLEKIKSGLGVNYTYDVLGFEENHTANFNYSYQFNLKEERMLSLGGSMGVLSKTLDAVWITPDGSAPQDDIALSNGTYTDITSHLGVFYLGKKLNMGLSTTNMNWHVNSSPSQHVFPYVWSYFQYCINVGADFNLLPRMLLKSDLSSAQLDISSQVIYRETYWLALGYRISNGISLNLGIDINKKYRVGYAYDHTTSLIKNYSKGSHEIILAYLLK